MKIKNIKKLSVEHSEPFYDIINAFPYNNFLVKCNDSYIISHNCAMLDECNFKSAAKDLNVLDAQNGIMDAYRTIRGRMTSRFIKNGVQYGRMFLVSSKRSDQDFVDTYINKRKSDGEASKMLIIDEPQWVIKPEGTYSKETFPVAVGNKSLQSRVLNEHTSQEELNALEKQGYRILKVPMDMKADFLLDVNKSLMDLAGISVIGATSFFNYDMFSKCYIEDYHNPFVTDILTIGMNDDLQISTFFEIKDIPPAVRAMPQFIHIDASLTGDKTGISSVGVSGIKETMQYNGAQEIISQELKYKHIFSVDIKAPQGTEISFEKTRQFIYFLKASGFNIRAVSLDGFQSADTKQILTSQGYDASIVSLDRSPQGYLTLRSAMNDGRIGLIQIDLLETELIQLQRDVRSGKLDHPDGGCFTADTLIQLVDGRQLSIADLLIEQEYKTNYVYTVNEVTKQIEPKPIKKVFQTKLVTELVEVELDNGEKIQCTPEHRFMLRDGTYLQACKLTRNTLLMSLCIENTNNKDIQYKVVSVTYINKSCAVYDLEIEDNHNFALASGVFVHNSKDMADSLAGALWNATLHKQSLIDGLQLLESAVDVNEVINPSQEFINDLQNSMMANNRNTTMSNASSKLDELMYGFHDSDIVSW